MMPAWRTSVAMVAVIVVGLAIGAAWGSGAIAFLPTGGAGSAGAAPSSSHGRPEAAPPWSGDRPIPSDARSGAGAPAATPPARMDGSITIDDLERIAADVREDPKTRNEAMDRLVGDARTADVGRALARVAGNTRDGDMVRSWAVQHLGLLVDQGAGAGARPGILADLRTLAASSPPGTLVRREALFALVTSDETSDRERVAQLARAALSTPEAEPDLDLFIRFAGMLHLHDLAARVAALREHASWIVRMSAQEAARKLGAAQP